MPRTKKQGTGLAQELESRREEASLEVAADRVRLLCEGKDRGESGMAVLYWMSRDCRVQDNWAMLHAQDMALKNGVPLYVCFSTKTTERSYRKVRFLVEGLKEVEEECSRLDIGFCVVESVLDFISSHGIGTVVCDFSPLREHRRAVEELAAHGGATLHQVDAHNVVPVWVASDKAEVGARTIRRKIHSKLGTYLTEFPAVRRHPHRGGPCGGINYDGAFGLEGLRKEEDSVVKSEITFRPGYRSGICQMELFFSQKVRGYDGGRNDPGCDAISGLSPWIHFGQIAPQRCVLLAFEHGAASFIEEMLVRRELSDNFCYYNENYDTIDGASGWARASLDLHRHDRREHVYSREEFEHARTHDELWNAAQTQMMRSGKMHGFLRMYWAKKILEWAESPEAALGIAIELNDRYNLDGCDPNGFVGCMWSICGVHDRGWKEREVFGKIRYMNFRGCARKFDVQAFIAMVRR